MNGKSPDAFRTISEVADWLGVNAHVLRFWESKFSQVKPVKRAGGRRYYRRADMELLGGIQKLLHEDGMTIKGVQKVLRDQGVKAVCAMSKPVDASAEDAEAAPAPVEPAPQEEPVSAAAPASVEAESTAAEPDSAPEPAETAPVDDPLPAALMPLFSHRPPKEPVDAPRSIEDAAAGDAAIPAEAASDADEGAPAQETPPSEGPVIAPLPSRDLPLAEALGHLVPMQIAPEQLAPIHARMVALRERMGAAG